MEILPKGEGGKGELSQLEALDGEEEKESWLSHHCLEFRDRQKQNTK